jgi:hypothetical protein
MTAIKLCPIMLVLALFAPLLSAVFTVGPAAAADWSTFSSDTFGFRVDYPSGWVADPTNQSATQTQLSQGFASGPIEPNAGELAIPAGGAYVFVTVDTPPAGTTLDDRIQQRFKGSTITTLPSRDLYGVPNVVLISDFTQFTNAEPIISLELFAQQAGHIYEVMCATRSREDFARWRSTCDRIMDSFSFTRIYFSETGHWVGGGFLAYWEQFGGLPIYGYPLTDEFVDQASGLTMQVFERARFEWHPGAWPERYDVELGLLGNELLPTHIPDFTPYPFAFTPPSGQASCRFFPNEFEPSVGFNVCNGFRAYWEQFGGLAVFGYPMSQEYVDPRTGFVTQYFERARFEWHPGAAPGRYDVLLGRLGAEWLTTNATVVSTP